MEPSRIPSLAVAGLLSFLVGCSPPPPHRPDASFDAPPPDALDYDVAPLDEGPGDGGNPIACDLPAQPVPGAVVPRGFCIRRYATVGVPRALAVAPNGDLFVTAPSTATPGGASGGPGAIVVLSDDNRDGTAETHMFATGLPDVHGIAIGNGFVYFTTGNNVWRTPYAVGQRRETGTREMIATFESLEGARWTHGLARTPNGTLYTTQGVYSALTCPDTPRNGTIQQVQDGSLRTVAAGFRNPMYIRCHFRDEACLVAELGDDGGASFGAREKIILVRANTNYGFPCCSTNGVTTPYNSGNRYDCSTVPREEAFFPLNDTPFGLDWERGIWPEPFRNAVFVALHGSFYSSPPWAGARIVFAATDPVTHAPVGPWMDFVLGFDYRGGPLDRPSDVAFSPDGRMFFSDDQGGAVYWVAPEGLRLR